MFCTTSRASVDEFPRQRGDRLSAVTGDKQSHINNRTGLGIVSYHVLYKQLQPSLADLCRVMTAYRTINNRVQGPTKALVLLAAISPLFCISMHALGFRQHDRVIASNCRQDSWRTGPVRRFRKAVSTREWSHLTRVRFVSALNAGRSSSSRHFRGSVLVSWDFPRLWSVIALFSEFAWQQGSLVLSLRIRKKDSTSTLSHVLPILIDV